ncbi:MAG: hypothetical protein QOI49_710 [Verrucomicrobiota bacterium]|jgi:hypothetical protein
MFFCHRARSARSTLPENARRKRLASVSGKLSILKEFWSFLRVRKKWWLAPIVVLLLTLGLILVLTEGSALAPFIYSLF